MIYTDKNKTATAIIGITGRMISGSKSLYRRAHPDHTVVFNANLCTAGGKFWYGDLDITLDQERLQELADTIGETVYVLYESDGRFENEGRPLLHNAIAQFNPTGNEKA